MGSVVWWRQSPLTPTIRVHHIGWVDVTGQPHGRLEIRSPHLRLDERTIQTALAEHLVPANYPTMPIIRPAHRVPETELSLEAGLIIDGHTITHRDLLIPFGIDVVAGISAELLVRGPHATIVLEETLQQPIRDAVLTTIRRSLHQFADRDTHRTVRHRLATPPRRPLATHPHPNLTPAGASGRPRAQEPARDPASRTST